MQVSPRVLLHSVESNDTQWDIRVADDPSLRLVPVDSTQVTSCTIKPSLFKNIGRQVCGCVDRPTPREGKPPVCLLDATPTDHGDNTASVDVRTGKGTDVEFHVLRRTGAMGRAELTRPSL